jgi:hypothetical protein
MALAGLQCRFGDDAGPCPNGNNEWMATMNEYAPLCDDFFINMNLSTEMELPANRETILHFFERVQKTYPTMRNFFCREEGDFMLEEDKDQGSYRWCNVESRRLCSGLANPDEIDDAMAQHKLVLELAPYMLSVSPLDCEFLDLLYGFDFTYRGNHNQLLADVLGVSPSMASLVESPGAAIMNFEPSLTLAMDPDCRLQFRVQFETRTNARQIRMDDFPEDQLTVFVTGRQYGSLDPDKNFVETIDRLRTLCHQMIDNHVIDHILTPIRQAIAMKGQ